MQRLDHLQRNFLWGDKEDSHKFHLINWNKVHTPLSCGGLRLRNLRPSNIAPVGKSAWRFAPKKEALWRKVVAAKYDELECGSKSSSCNSPYGCNVWKFIYNQKHFFQQNIRYFVGHGNIIKFWSDTWCADWPLCSSFPNLFSFAYDRDASIYAVLCIGDFGISWNPRSFREVNDWELSRIESFLSLLYSTKFGNSTKDAMC